MGGRTFGKIFSGLKIIRIDEKKGSLISYSIREIFLKGLVGIILPLYVFENVPLRTNFLLISYEMFIVGFLSVLFLLIFKRTWWEWFSGTLTIKNKEVSKSQLNSAFWTMVVIFIVFILISVHPILLNLENLLTKLPTPYPKTKEVKYYADYVKNHSQNPEDYIFDLFKKFDIVVISERMHPEYSQYEFIFKVIKDKRFVDQVGNIFTECGSISYQDSLDKYMHTFYKTQDELNRATARLSRSCSAIWPIWGFTNLFDLLKTVHSLNCTKSDTSKIKWYFTDLTMNWQTATHQTFLNNNNCPSRDRFMAGQVVEKYKKVISKQKRSKALVIMNSYHGYGLAPNGENYFGSATGYMMNKLPGKVSNVMMNTVSNKYLYAYVPNQNGKWDAAFELADNPMVGFNFKGSPFGDDHFDLRFLQIKGLKYKDVFTGLIFYYPLNKQFQKDNFPFELDGFEDEILRRAAIVDQEYIDNIQRKIEIQKKNPENPYSIRPTNLSLTYNLINDLVIPLLFFLSLIIIVILYLVKRRHV
jgi:hypothetical protein